MVRLSHVYCRIITEKPLSIGESLELVKDVMLGVKVQPLYMVIPPKYVWVDEVAYCGVGLDYQPPIF